MKHEFTVTLFLMALFFSSQFVGLFIVNKSIEEITFVNGTIDVTYVDVPTGRPETEGWGSFHYLLLSVLVGTALVLLIIKYRLFGVWKVWFLLAVGTTLTVALSVLMNQWIALAIGFGIAYLKIFRPNIFVHNISEVFMYSGIAVLLVPIFDIPRMIAVLVAISVYDAYAVWKSKHMIKMAQFQAESKMFAGLHIPYQVKKEGSSEKKRHEDKTAVRTVKIETKMPKRIAQEGDSRSAILGGGDIAFPLLFAGTVMTGLLEQAMSRPVAFLMGMVVSSFAGIALYLLFWKSEKGKFYPAMPFITAGCLAGYGVVLALLHFFF